MWPRDTFVPLVPLVPPGSDSPCDDDTITRTLETFFLNEKIYGWEISRELLAALIVEDINSLQLKIYCCFEEDLLELILIDTLAIKLMFSKKIKKFRKWKLKCFAVSKFGQWNIGDLFFELCGLPENINFTNRSRWFLFNQSFIFKRGIIYSKEN